MTKGRASLGLALLAGLLGALAGCGADEAKPLSIGAGGSGGSGGNEAEAGVPPTCDPAMGTTACDVCVYGQCCDAALSCAAGTPCDALWACARSAGCLSPQTSDFDGCVVVACPMLATSDALAGLVELATCIRTSCGSPCGS